MDEKCSMCGTEEAEKFHSMEEWKSATICYACGFIEIVKRFYIKSKEESDKLGELADLELEELEGKEE